MSTYVRKKPRKRPTTISSMILDTMREYGRAISARDVCDALPHVPEKCLITGVSTLNRQGIILAVNIDEMGRPMRPWRYTINPDPVRKPKGSHRDPEAVMAELMRGSRFEDVDPGPKTFFSRPIVHRYSLTGSAAAMCAE